MNKDVWRNTTLLTENTLSYQGTIIRVTKFRGKLWNKDNAHNYAIETIQPVIPGYKRINQSISIDIDGVTVNSISIDEEMK